MSVLTGWAAEKFTQEKITDSMNKFGILAVLFTVIFSSSQGGDLPYVVPIVVVKYFPIKGDSIEKELFAKKAVDFVTEKSFLSGLTEEVKKWFEAEKK